MAIIDTSSWMDAALRGQRFQQNAQDQALQQQVYQDSREDRQRRLAQEAADQALAARLGSFLIGGQPQPAQNDPTQYGGVYGPPSMQDMAAQQQSANAPLMPSGGPDIAGLLGRASPAGASRAIDDVRQIQAQFANQRRMLELQSQKQQVASMYEPIIRTEFPAEHQADALALLDTFANTTMTADQFRRGLRQMQDDIESRRQDRFDASVMAGWDPTGQQMGPPMDLAGASPQVVQRIRGWEQAQNMLGQRNDFAAQQQEDRQQYGMELEGMRQGNRLGVIDHRAEVAARAKELSPQEFEQQVQDVMASNPRAGRAEAEAYVRGRHDGLFNQIQPNISGGTRNGGLTQSQKDEELSLRIEIDSRERQLNRVTAQIKDETDPARKNELLAEADFANKYIARLEQNLMNMVRSRTNKTPSAPSAPKSQTPATTPSSQSPVPASPVNARLGDGTVVQLDQATINRIIDEETAKGGSDAEVADRVQRRIKAGG